MTRQFGGLGLGLAISKHLVGLHHGTIEAGSRGRSFGATFKVTLDRLPEGVGTTDLGSRAPKHPPKPLRILLVEDHRDTRHTLSRLLTHFGHEVLTADNIKRAMEIVTAEKIDDHYDHRTGSQQSLTDPITNAALQNNRWRGKKKSAEDGGFN